ncbi:helix-turn-helix domain-containing protein [Chitinophaga niastensis]|nr:AraC family transcriptional regulator [Chitinophaga niastensis]
MVTTIEHLPALPLRNYIRCYCLREIDTHGTDLLKAIHAIDQSFMTFWLSNTPLLYETDKGVQQINIKQRQLLGIPSCFQGHQTYNGKYCFFTVHFRANGFFRIFNIPMCHLSDHLLHSDDLIGKNVQFLQEQLEEAGNMEEMTSAADQYFLTALLKNKAKNTVDNITAAANTILRHHDTVNIKALAQQVNMSLRGFEQHFAEQVGITPRLFARVVRFNKVLLLKTMHPHKNWTDIAHSCGYFDQMHLVKDFKVFSGHSPRSFLQQLPPPRENFIKTVDGY